jgi:hypothetical protein
MRVMAGLVFASFWTVLFTGAVRKWLVPGVSALYLLQDVPIGLSYIYAIRSGLISRGYLMLATVCLAGMITVQALFQIIVPGLSPIIAFIGLHNYLFYFPILLIFPVCLTHKYRQDFIRWNLLLSIPMCLLAIGQALSPKAAFINKSSEGEAFGVPGADIARVSGTFNFTFFYAIWVGLAVALCMGEWLLPKEKRAVKQQWLLIVCSFTVNICHLVSGSRGAIALGAAAVVGAMVAAVILRSKRAIYAVIGICIFLPVAGAMTYFISPDEFNIIAERFTGESYQADNKNRAMDSLFGFATIPKFSLVGAGVGMGVDAAHIGSSDAYNYTYDLAEQDIIRNVMELGTPVGLTYALSRIFFAFGMILLAGIIVKSGGPPHVLPIALVMFSQTYTGDLTRAATMTATQVFMGYSFILGALYHPDEPTPELAYVPQAYPGPDLWDGGYPPVLDAPAFSLPDQASPQLATGEPSTRSV